MMDRRVVERDGIIKAASYQDEPLIMPDGSRTLFQLLENKTREYPQKEFMGSIVDGRVEYKTYEEVSRSVKRLAGFLERITEEKEIIGLYSVNRIEWIIGEYASYYAGCCNCPIYSTFGPETLRAILQETEVRVIITSSDKGRSLLESTLGFVEGSAGTENGTYSIKHIILMDDDKKLAQQYASVGIEVHSLGDILANEDYRPTRPEPSPSDIATVCYTSGTSGNPKGVVLTHLNFIAAISGYVRNTGPNMYVVLSGEHVYFSYLPLPHVLERICFGLAWCSLAKIVFYRGDPKLLQADMKIAKPTFIVTVPRVLNLFMEKIKASVAQKNWFVRTLFDLGLKFKLWRLKSSGCYRNWLLDTLIFGKVSKEFGGALFASLCGGASLNPEVLQFLEVVLGFKIFQGYGQTEGLAANIVATMDDNDPETVGIPFPTMQLKLAELDDFEPAEHADGSVCGELLMRGHSVTSGYYKKPKETAAAFTEDGWLRTGDIARYCDGRFYIIGRVKEMFKTSFGEYIIPEKVENCLCGGIVEDVFITNSQFSDFLLAIIVCTDTSIGRDALIELVKSRAAVCFEDKTMARYEIPSHFVVIREQFIALDGGSLITPSLKKRRKNIAEYFKNEIDAEFSK